MKWRFFVAILLLVSSVMMVVGLVKGMEYLYDPNLGNTTEYTATFSGVQIMDNADYPHAMLQTEEYSFDFYITTEVFYGIKADLYELESGEMIYVRIPNLDVKQTDQAVFVNAVSLRTQDKEIFSLKDYKEQVATEAIELKAKTLIVAGGLFVLSVYCAVSPFIKRKKVNKTPSTKKLPWDYSAPKD